MKVKIDTREKFHVITILESSLPANMTEEMEKLGSRLQDNNVKNVIINMKDIENLDKAAAEQLLAAQQGFYEQNASFVICAMRAEIKQFLDKADLLDLLNYTPTESEAMDIVQMEEIERELDNQTPLP